MCPGGMVTGGPEALHQLVDSVRRQGEDAAILYTPDASVATPSAYHHYDTPAITHETIPRGSLVVVPETSPHLAQGVPGCATGLWWLSVNYAPHGAARTPVDVHLTQSDYARAHLAGLGVESMPLGDYLMPRYVDRGEPREPAIAVNAAKGAMLQRVMRALAPDIHHIPIRGMSPDEVAAALNKVVAYVEFGPQPGRDRLPREAAACGAVVFARRAGAGANAVDTPLPLEFTFTRAGMLGMIRELRGVLSNPTPAHRAQAGYRAANVGDRDRFDAQVRDLIAWHRNRAGAP